MERRGLAAADQVRSEARGRRDRRREAEVEHAEVVLRLLLPSDEDAAEAVHPTVRALDDPAPGLEARAAAQRLGLLAACADVRGVAELVEQLVDLGVVVALVETHPLALARPRLGPLHRDALDRLARPLAV